MRLRRVAFFCSIACRLPHIRSGWNPILKFANLWFHVGSRVRGGIDKSMDHKTQGGIEAKEGLKEFIRLLLQRREHDVLAPSAKNVMRKFNRGTAYLATGLLASFIFAALLLALQERQKIADQSTEQWPTSGELSWNANLGRVSTGGGLNAESSIDQSSSGQATSAAQALPAISSRKSASPHTDIPEATQSPVSVQPPGINLYDAPDSASSSPSQQPYDFARVIRSKIHNLRHRSSVRLRSLGVKMRLIALWHQRLERSQRSRGWKGLWEVNH